jgi:hypothetical protein
MPFFVKCKLINHAFFDCVLRVNELADPIVLCIVIIPKVLLGDVLQLQLLLFISFKHHGQDVNRGLQAILDGQQRLVISEKLN